MNSMEVLGDMTGVPGQVAMACATIAEERLTPHGRRRMMPALPSGTVSFLFTDIEGSTARWQHDAAAMWQAVEGHFDLLRQAIAAEDGVLFKKIGDAAQAAFPSVPAAVRAAIAAQRALAAADFPAVGPLPVRMAIHIGDATPVEGDYLAPALNRLARVLGITYGGQILLTEAAWEQVSANLPTGYTLRDLGGHRLKDLLVAERIYQLTGPELRDDFPPLKSLDLRPHNLPAQPTELIGRESEVAQLRALLTAPGTRLVTLTGPGGTGKSRLALQTAADILEAFPDGVWWIPLAAITDPALVPEAIAKPLGLRERPGERLIDTVNGHLRARTLLLVLDNLEQILTSAPLIAQVLESAPGLVILATSREPLRLRGEREYPVAPLNLPPIGARLAPEEILAFPAVRLFVERAEAVRAGFALTAENASAVIAICRQLDGLPLAIELAAARARLLPPAALLARLEKRLPLLTGGPRDLPERQQTLRATIAWSHDMLAPPERTVFARLAVFAGGCTLDAAEVVVTADGGVDIDLFDAIEGLVQKSLLRQTAEPQDEPRFSMLETIREFALDQLAALPDEGAAVHTAHADYFRHLLTAAVDSDDQVAAYDDLEIELDNLRAALDWQERHGEAGAALELATDLRWFWWVRGHLREGRTRLETALRLSPSAPPALRAKALSGLGVLLEAGGDYERAKFHHEEALALYRDIGDEPGIADALENLGIVAANQGDLTRSAALREEVLALRRATGDKRGIAVALINLANVAYLRGSFDQAIELYEEARTLSLETSDQWILTIALGNIGGALIRRTRGEANASVEVKAAAETEAQATALIRQALSISRSLGDRERILDGLLMLAEAAALDEPKHAALLLGAVDALAAESGFQVSPADPRYHTHIVESVRATLGDPGFAAVWREGARLSLEDTIAVALDRP
jgi:predicted ATPase/class 3 adenylate cyclase